VDLSDLDNHQVLGLPADQQDPVVLESPVDLYRQVDLEDPVVQEDISAISHLG